MEVGLGVERVERAGVSGSFSSALIASQSQASTCFPKSSSPSSFPRVRLTRSYGCGFQRAE